MEEDGNAKRERVWVEMKEAQSLKFRKGTANGGGRLQSPSFGAPV